MTQQVRTSYRKHRRATWAAVIAVVAMVAAVAIPFASGDAGKSYQFTGNLSVCAGTTSATFNVTVTNQSRTQNLGSADLYAPANITVTSAGWADVSQGGSAKQLLGPTTYSGAVTVDPNDPTSTGRSLISLRSLTLPYGASVTVKVTASITGASKNYWYSIAKQANQFNPGSLDLSNALTISGSNPYVESVTCTLGFVTQPQDPWQKSTTQSPAVSVALLAGTTPQPSSSLNPSLAATGAGTTSNFDGISTATYDSTTKTWSWPLSPQASAPSGTYNLVASANGFSSVTSNSFRVADSVCAPNTTCDTTSNLGNGPTGKVTLTNTLQLPLVLDFQPGGGPLSCSPWNQASFTDPNDPTKTLYFPAVRMDYSWGSTMLQVTYKVRNDQWVLTNVSRGNQDADFCVGARHQFQTNLNDGQHPFVGKYTTSTQTGVRWGCADPVNGCAVGEQPAYWGVLANVSNPQKVKSGGDPAVCGRGTQDILDPATNATVTWRTWTICIPYDWDWSNKIG